MGVCKSESVVNGKTVFAGLRHGINSARGIKAEALAEMPDDGLKDMVEELLIKTPEFLTSKEMEPYHPKNEGDQQYVKNVIANLRKDKKFREQAAKIMKVKADVNRCNDLVKAAAVMDPQKLDQAINSGKPLKISMTSVGLQTSGIGMEGAMIRDQRRAWKAISGKTVPMKFKRKVMRNNTMVDEVVTVQVEVEVNSFNFGVNNMAFGALKGKAGLGWMSDKKNIKPMANLIGNNSENGLGGQVAPGSRRPGNKKRWPAIHPMRPRSIKKSKSSWPWRRTSTKCGQRKNIAAKATRPTRCRRGWRCWPRRLAKRPASIARAARTAPA